MLLINMDSAASKRKENPEDGRQQQYVIAAQTCAYICFGSLDRGTTIG